MESKLPEDELPVQLLESISNEADEVTDEKASGRVTAYKYGYRDGYFIGATSYAPWKVKYDELCERYKTLDQAMFAMQQERLKAQPCVRWVKASERLPMEAGPITWRWLDKEAAYSGFDGTAFIYDKGGARVDMLYAIEIEWYDESAAGREDWVSVEDRPLIRRNNEWWEITEDGENEFIAAVPYCDAETDDPTKDRWWIRHCYIDSEGYLNVKRDNEMDEDVAGWNVSDITHWKPLPEPPKFKQQKGK